MILIIIKYNLANHYSTWFLNVFGKCDYPEMMYYTLISTYMFQYSYGNYYFGFKYYINIISNAEMSTHFSEKTVNNFFISIFFCTIEIFPALKASLM